MWGRRTATLVLESEKRGLWDGKERDISVIELEGLAASEMLTYFGPTSACPSSWTPRSECRPVQRTP